MKMVGYFFDTLHLLSQEIWFQEVPKLKQNWERFSKKVNATSRGVLILFTNLPCEIGKDKVYIMLMQEGNSDNQQSNVLYSLVNLRH